MDKTKLAICMEDEEYEARFVKCVMNHYKESYEIHIVDDIEKIAEEQKREFHVIVTGDDSGNTFCDGEAMVRLVLQENAIEHVPDSEDNVFYTEKYQEVYKIMEVLEQAVVQQSSQKIYQVGRTTTQLIGVFSLEKEGMQIPFTALLAEILGDRNRVLVIDLQPFSGFSVELDTEENALGMEDLMTIATTENYTSNRLAASIGHEQKWDYVYPVRNVQCLAEANVELYRKIIEILQKERGYEQVILNFGAVFPGVGELMEDCQQFYVLTERKEESSWREENFLHEMRCRGKEGFLQKFTWMEIQARFVKERSWRQLAKSWLWSELGDQLRERNWMESGNSNGAYM